MKTKRVGIRILLVTASVILCMAIVLVVNFLISHKTCLKYNDSKVLGHTLTEIQEKYGEFDLVYEHKAAYCIDPDVSPDFNQEYYFMVTDDADTVTNVYVSGRPGG